jgi:hypothetical protein
MATIKISQLSELTADTDVTSNDLLQIINIEETSSTFPTGTNRKIRASTLANGLSRLTTTIPQVIQTALDRKVSLENFNSAGLKIAIPVVAASPVINFTLSNITPGSSMDGVTLASGNRVLLKNQDSPAQNGIYVVQTSGPPIRATDFDTLLEINDGYVLVDGGNTLKGSSWVVTSDVAVIGTDPINFTQFSSAATGLSKSAVGLGNVDNTSDLNKPVSTLTAAAIAVKANIANPTFSGTVTAVTFSGNLSGNVTGSSGSCTGNAATATTCTGNAATATFTTTPTFSGDSVIKDDITTRTETGFYQTASGTTGEGWPITNDTFQHLISCTHNNDSNYYSMQLGGSFYDQEFYGRKTNGSGTQSWTRFVTSANSTSFNSNLATKASTLSAGGGNGSAMTFNWNGQGGQPTWLWGGNDIGNMYVWNPSNFSVNYANSAAYAERAALGPVNGSFTQNHTANVAKMWIGGFGPSQNYGIVCQKATANNTNGSALHFMNAAGTTVGSIVLDSANSTNYNTTSDYRLKTDYRPIEKPLERLLSLKPTNFKWINDGTRLDGFIAHEVQEVVSNAVNGNKDEVDNEGNPVYQQMDAAKLIPLIAAAMQEQQKIIDFLIEEVKALKNVTH